MQHFKDESFILQYLSPKMIRDLKLFCVLDDDEQAEIEVAAIHDEMGYQQVREALSAQYNLGNREPNIQIVKVDVRGDRSLTLHHNRHERAPMNDETGEVLKHLHRLWGFDVHLHSVDHGDTVQSWICPVREAQA
jgi:spore cortex formation protein SpoVR/YcgB (stage V sporulation)